jgi:hypothetical protein
MSGAEGRTAKPRLINERPIDLRAGFVDRSWVFEMVQHMVNNSSATWVNSDQRAQEISNPELACCASVARAEAQRHPPRRFGAAQPYSSLVVTV